jgi:hypothetical protein
MNLKALFWFFVLASIGLGNAHAIGIVKIDSASVGFDNFIEVNITAIDVSDLANFNILVSYSPSIVNVTGAVNNPVFQTDLNNFKHANSGSVNIANFNFGDGQSGDVWISTLTLKAMGNPGDDSDLNIQVISFANPSGNTIPVSTEIGTVEINALLTTTTFTPTTTPSTTPSPTPSLTTSTPTTTPQATEPLQLTNTPSFFTIKRGLFIGVALIIILLVAYLLKKRSRI